MKIKKKILASMLCLTLIGMVGCNNNNDKTDNQNSTAQTETTEEIEGVSLQNPIKVDKEAKTVTVLASVNGKYFNEPTRHCSVFKGGSNGDKSIFTAYATPEEVYNGLMEIGAKPGDNMTKDNAQKTHVEGTPLKLEVTWNGADKRYTADEVIKDSNGKKIDFRFGGNLEMAKKKNTGCDSCLDSCPVGIISNATYTYGAVEKRDEVKFNGNADVLPEDGTYVATIYSITE